MLPSLILLILGLICTHLANASVSLLDFESEVIRGRSYAVRWSSDSEDVSGQYHPSHRHKLIIFQYLTLLLIRKHSNSLSWTTVQTLFTNRTSSPPGDNYTWYVNNNLAAKR